MNCPVCGQTGKHAFIGRDLLRDLPEEYNYSECVACSAVFQSPTPTPERIASFYDEDYDPYKPGTLKKKNPLERAVLRTHYGYTHLESNIPDWIGRMAGFLFYTDVQIITVNNRRFVTSKSPSKKN